MMNTLTIKHLVKTEERHLDACGQFSLAMVTGIPVEEIALELGTWGGTSTKQLSNYLISKGFSYGESYTANQTEYEYKKGTGILIIRADCDGHAVAYDNGKILDPNGLEFGCHRELLEYYTTETGEVWEVFGALPAKKIKTREWKVKGGEVKCY